VKPLTSKTAILSAVLAAGFMALSPAAMAKDKNSHTYLVTIQNATKGQPIAPSVIATHTGEFRFFDIGPAPMPGDWDYDDYFALAAMAETGYPFHVLDQILAADGVSEAVALPSPHTVLFPGESNSTLIGAAGNARYLTALAMLGRTNDGFYAVQAVELPKHKGEVVRVLATAYDAGSEANDESPATVGALGSMEDNGASGTGINEGGEGYIHVHSGIHGVGGPSGLMPASDDWDGPVVEVTIERMD